MSKRTYSHLMSICMAVSHPSYLPCWAMLYKDISICSSLTSMDRASLCSRLLILSKRFPASLHPRPRLSFCPLQSSLVNRCLSLSCSSFTPFQCFFPPCLDIMCPYTNWVSLIHCIFHDVVFYHLHAFKVGGEALELQSFVFSLPIQNRWVSTPG